MDDCFPCHSLVAKTLIEISPTTYFKTPYLPFLGMPLCIEATFHTVCKVFQKKKISAMQKKLYIYIVQGYLYIGQYNIELLMVLVPFSFLTKLCGPFVGIDRTFPFISTNYIYIFLFLFLSCCRCVHNTLPCLTHQLSLILYTVLFKEIIYNSYQNVYAEVCRQSDCVGVPAATVTFEQSVQEERNRETVQ